MYLDSSAPPTSGSELTWQNVAIASCFIAFDAIVSRVYGLGVGSSLTTAAIRCVVQLSVVALVLQKVFKADNVWAVAGIACLLNLTGTSEIVVNKAKRRYQYMFPSILFAMLISTIPVSILGVRFAMAMTPFWKPDQYVPVVGMLCGSTISGIVIVLNYILKEINDNYDKVETMLAFGASRAEACKPIATEALRLALTPCINQMSVLGIIAIPGMMTGAILGGSSVQQAARLQMIIIFMISASTALACIVATVLALSVVVDAQHRIRPDRVDARLHAVWRGRNRLAAKGVLVVKLGWTTVRAMCRNGEIDEKEQEMEVLLGEQ